MVIKQTFLNHKGGIYIYRLHEPKLNKLCKENGFNKLKQYLESVFSKCPNELFNNGPRGSCLKFQLIDGLNNVSGHEVSTLAKLGLDVNKDRFRDNHSKVQVCMLENDKTTIAMEVPIWLNPKEFAAYEHVFKSKENLTGHIDVLRIENGHVWIWDYKPNAQKEKYAATQIFFYALMLSKRTGIPLEEFRCGYFDQHHSYLFKPSEDSLLRLNKQKSLKTSF